MTDIDIYEDNFKNIHFIGIGGVSMSGLASILLKRNYTVSGSDMNSSDITDNLKDKGAIIHLGHSSKNLKDVDLVIYTDAISSDNPEYVYAIKHKIPMMDRGSFLGKIMREYSDSIAVSGTHGKTSTTAMISTMLADSILDPTILLGGHLDKLNGNIRIGGDKLLITEACEYKKNLLKFYASIGIILNIEADHLDFYKDLDEIIDTFSEFASTIPSDGYLVVNLDDKNTKSVIESAVCNVVTFGLDSGANYRAADIVYGTDGSTSYKLTINNKDSYDVKLKVLGIHNVYNSLAAIAASHIAGVDIPYLLEHIADFLGTKRRLDYKGDYNGITIIDDYAHHPTEVKVTLSSIKELKPKRVFCIFQPHTYTRTSSLLEEFGASFSDTDKVIVADIYAAREKDTGLIHSKDLVEKLIENNTDAVYMNNFEDIESFIFDNCHSGDIVVTMGAGDIYKIGESLLSKKK